MTSLTGKLRAELPPAWRDRIRLGSKDVVIGCCTDTRDEFTRVLEEAMREQGLEPPDLQNLNRMVINIDMNVQDDRVRRVVSVKDNVLYVEDLLPVQDSDGEYTGSLQAASSRTVLPTHAAAVQEAELLFGAARTALGASTKAGGRITRRK